jgi:hypothetical protein
VRRRHNINVEGLFQVSPEGRECDLEREVVHAPEACGADTNACRSSMCRQELRRLRSSTMRDILTVLQRGLLIHGKSMLFLETI